MEQPVTQTFASMGFHKKALWCAFLFLVIAMPISAYFSKSDAEKTDNLSCLAVHEISILELIKLKYQSYNKECGEAQAVMAIANLGIIRNPQDMGMVAVALGAWRLKFPRLGEMMGKVTDEIIKNPEAFASKERLLIIPPAKPSQEK